MTEQIQDVVVWDDQEFEIAGLDSAAPLFEPTDHGLKPRTISTACWRGWHMRLQIKDRRLKFDTLTIGLSDSELTFNDLRSEPTVFGVPLRQYQYESQRLAEDGTWVSKTEISSESRATNIDGELVWDGHLLLGDNPRYFGILGHPAWYYHRIIECEFIRGVLVGHWDRSEECQRIVDWFESDESPDPPEDPFGSDKLLYENWERGFDAMMGAVFRGKYCKYPE